MAKALAHPARVRVLRLLVRREGCIGCDIVADLELAQSTVSEHLRVLKTAGLVEGEVDGPRVCYRLSRAGLTRFRAVVAALLLRPARLVANGIGDGSNPGALPPAGAEGGHPCRWIEPARRAAAARRATN
ncbi:ArsR/SmtB family transcription factor [Falsiroseomonas sp.]|uniref:ArsR/SmtB family transcription factor n=1 Tax=Falsiroseomonas sp. TaxID=2870721 RepID=UPI0035615824